MPFLPRLLILLAVVIAVCVPDARGNETDPASAHADAGTARAWEVGSEWTFTAKDAHGATQTFVFHVTNRPWGRSDRWFELDVVSDPRPSWISTLWHADGTATQVESRFSAVASIEGDRVEINLMAGMKDASDRLVGELDGDRFRGERRRGSMLDDEERIIPGVVGWRVR